MMGATLTTVNYQGQDGQISWRGISMRDDDGFKMKIIY